MSTDLSGYKIQDGSTTYVQELQDFVDRVEVLFNTLPKTQESETVVALDTSVAATIDIDTSLGTYFYTDTALLTKAITFTFSNPVITERLTKFQLELLDADGATITWPTSVDWEGGAAPIWTADNRDVAEFTTRDNGTTWYGKRITTNILA